MQNFEQPVNTEINPINNNILKYYVNTIKIIILIKKKIIFFCSL